MRTWSAWPIAIFHFVWGWNCCNSLLFNYNVKHIYIWYTSVHTCTPHHHNTHHTHAHTHTHHISVLLMYYVYIYVNTVIAFTVTVGQINMYSCIVMRLRGHRICIIGTWPVYLVTDQCSLCTWTNQCPLCTWTDQCPLYCRYLTCTEWRTLYGGKKEGIDKGEFRRLPFFCCR